VLDQYRRNGIIAEKYDVVHRDTAIGSEIRYGYRSNEVGFGWTNAVFTALLDDLPPAVQSVLLNPNSSTH